MTELTAIVIERDMVLVEGPETAAFLHGQISQDVEDLSVGESRLSLLLEPRGRLEVFFRLTRIADEAFLMDTEPGSGEVLRSSLERFKLRTKAEFSQPDWSMLALRGPGAATAAPSAAGAATLDALWPGLEGVDVVGPELQVPPGADVIDFAEYEDARARFGLPAMGLDVVEGDIPNDTDLLEVAVSFTKGCYRGQELVERIDSRAGGRRALRRFSSTGSLSAGDELVVDGSPVGEVRSAVASASGSVGFALVAADAGGQASFDGVSVELGELRPPA